MTPRLKSSTKWTAVPPELCEQIQDVFAENFEEAAKKGQIFVSGRIYAQEMLLQVGYLPQGRLRQANFEISMDFDPKKQNALELIHFAVDCAASLFQEYFEVGEDLDNFPIEWKSYNIEGRPVFVQVSTVNTTLEAEADRLLGAASDDLVQGEDEIDEEIAKKSVITMLGLAGADDEVDTDNPPLDESEIEITEKLVEEDLEEGDESDDDDSDEDGNGGGKKRIH